MTKFHVDRGDPAERADLSRNDGRGRDKKTGLCGLGDLPRTTDDEALELMVHHLELAAVYYKNTPEDPAAVLAEVERIMRRDDPSPTWVSDALTAARPWLAAIRRYHDDLKKEQEDRDEGRG